VTSVAKQPYPAAQSNGFENVDLGMQFPAYQNEGIRYFVGVKALA
jgi:hypothetical protein